MTTIDSEAIIAEWIAATNTHDLDKYLSFLTDDAVLDDPSVGSAFNGKPGITEYFEAYFIGYNTKTRLVSVQPQDGYFHVEVDFTGDFPGGQTGGIFDITLTGDMISHVKANLT